MSDIGNGKYTFLSQDNQSWIKFVHEKSRFLFGALEYIACRQLENKYVGFDVILKLFLLFCNVHNNC